jgi:NAD(P)H-hydrate epimerase
VDLTRNQVRDLDRRAIEEFATPGIVLMENAGRGCAELLLRLGIHAPVVICCGKGNNGGDGFVMARHLDNHRIPVRILLFADPQSLTGDAAVNYQILSRSGLLVQTIAPEDMNEAALRRRWTGGEWLVDALFGTGLNGPVRSPFDGVIDSMNRSGLRIFAVDMPSGLDCDSGEPLGPTVRARHTATFVAVKKGFLTPSARDWTGQVHVIPIGAPREYRFLEPPLS